MEKLNRIHNINSFKLEENTKLKNQKDIFSKSVENIISWKNIDFSQKDLALVREEILAKIFWLSKENTEKLAFDYKKDFTLSETINNAENYWEYKKTRS